MDELLFSLNAGIATVTINRPRQRNAITHAMWREIEHLCAHIDTLDDVRVVIWQGAGDQSFSAGGDIAEFAAQRSNKEQARAYNATVQAGLESIVALRRPTIAVVKGYCVGGGFILAAHCDIRIAADNARFGIPVAKLGALITHEQMQRFVHLVGAATITDLLLTGRLVDADEARFLGLCSQAYPLREIDEQVRRQASAMVDHAPLVQQWHKQMVQTVLHKPDLATLTPEEWGRLDACFDSEDYAEGTAAFLEKRAPHFSGR